MQTLNVGDQTVQVMTETEFEIYNLKETIKELTAIQEMQDAKIAKLEKLISHTVDCKEFRSVQEILANSYGIETREQEAGYVQITICLQ